MIYVNKANNSNRPVVLEFDNSVFIKKTKKIIEQKKIKDNDIFYKKEEIKTNLFRLYNYKCAFCEGKTDIAQNPLEIDHYRPKNKIKSQADNEYGYYWLGYEWTNLLPICKYCNSNKFTHFPIKNNKRDFSKLEKNIIKNSKLNPKVFNINELNDIEKPYLLNPDIDEVEKYFIFLKNGKIIPVKKSKKAEKTIEILKLNRPNLIISRKKYIDKKFSELLNKFNVSKNETELINLLNDRLRYINQLRQKHNKYSRLGYFMFFLFENFIIERFKTEGLLKHAKILKKTYNDFILQNTN